MIALPEPILIELPEWADASVSELRGGLTSHAVWLVDSGECKAVLKIDETPRKAPFNSRREEARIQEMAEQEGLANKVLYVDDTMIMSEYAEGIVWSTDCLEDNDNIAQLAAALRRLHSLPLTGKTFDAMGAARNYVSGIADPDVEKVKDCLQKIEAGPLPPNLCCCHNDLVVDNILNVPETRFIDWEYACDNDPFFDLATIAAHHKLTQAQRDTLLDAYFDGDGARWHEQLARQANVYEALLYLWEQSRSL